MIQIVLQQYHQQFQVYLQQFYNQEYQYFLLVRLIRSTIMDTRLAGIFNLENIDILDYRIAANTLEIAGDTVVELSESLIKSNLSKVELKKLHDFAKDMEEIQIKSIDSFISNNRTLAINAITLQRKNCSNPL